MLMMEASKKNGIRGTTKLDDENKNIGTTNVNYNTHYANLMQIKSGIRGGNSGRGKGLDGRGRFSHV